MTDVDERLWEDADGNFVFDLGALGGAQRIELRLSVIVIDVVQQIMTVAQLVDQSF